MFSNSGISQAQKDFAVFCVEEYRTRHGLSGKIVHEIFDKTGLLDYVIDCYDVLHSFGVEYLMDDFQDYLKNHSQKLTLLSSEARRAVDAYS